MPTYVGHYRVGGQERRGHHTVHNIHYAHMDKANRFGFLKRSGEQNRHSIASVKEELRRTVTVDLFALLPTFIALAGKLSLLSSRSAQFMRSRFAAQPMLQSLSTVFAKRRRCKLSRKTIQLPSFGTVFSLLLCTELS